MNNIRNFSIIAHIDHGKSTLADRMLELTGTVEARIMREQVLDSMDLERERGITIKMQPVRMHWRKDETEYVLNLIDTPGHVDFAYEVSRALFAVEGAILLVDATQGVQAQTLSVLDIAQRVGLTIIPALSKVDAPHARVEEVCTEIAELIDCDPEEVILTSGKTGEGVDDLLSEIVNRVSPPKDTGEKKPKALIFDFQYSDHRGVIVYVRVKEGSIRKGDALQFVAAKESFNALEVGVLTPSERKKESLDAGEIGYIVTGIKRAGTVSVGDSIIARGSGTTALPGFKKPAPVIWASFYPESETAARSSDAFAALKQALERLSLSDSSLYWEEEQSSVLGRGFRCGFLGMLHLEIITERLRREFKLDIIVTMPSVAYRLEWPDGKNETVYTPSKFPEHGARVTIHEPWVRLDIIAPSEYIGTVFQVLTQFEGILGETEQMTGGRMHIHAEMPLRELMRNFFDKLKSATSGYATVAYEFIGDRAAEVERLDILIAEEPTPALARVVSTRRMEEEARATVERLRNLLPAQQFVLKIQAKAKGRIIASERIAARRKDVTGYLYGGDVTRKMKLLEKQKKGKKRAQATGKANIPHDIFLKMLRDSDT